MFMSWQALLPGAGGDDVGSTVDEPAGIDGFSVSGAIVRGGSTVGNGPSVDGTVDRAMVITDDVEVGAGGIVSGVVSVQEWVNGTRGIQAGLCILDPSETSIGTFNRRTMSNLLVSINVATSGSFRCMGDTKPSMLRCVDSRGYQFGFIDPRDWGDTHRVHSP